MLTLRLYFMFCLITIVDLSPVMCYECKYAYFMTRFAWYCTLFSSIHSRFHSDVIL